VKELFAPDHTPELEFVKQTLKGAEVGANEIVFAIFTFAGSSGIDERWSCGVPKLRSRHGSGRFAGRIEFGTKHTRERATSLPWDG